MNDKNNQPSQQDLPHSYLASVPRANDVADDSISRGGSLSRQATVRILPSIENRRIDGSADCKVRRQGVPLLSSSKDWPWYMMF